MRTIRVTGKGQIKVKPDMTRITMTVTDVCNEYGETLRRSSEDTEALKDVLSGFGFEKTDLKTLSFNVDTEYESYRDKNNDYKQRFVGYKYTHMMKLEFDSDNERLGKVLYQLANADVQPQFRISYTVKDTESAKNALLADAVQDAKDKAAVLAKAADVRLGQISSIDYSFSDLRFETQPMRNVVFAKAARVEADAAYGMSIEPDDIEVEDTVTVVWEIGEEA